MASGIIGGVALEVSSEGTLSLDTVTNIPIVVGGAVEAGIGIVAGGYGAYYAREDFDKLCENIKNGVDTKVTLSKGEAQLKHIFRDEQGHILDTPENRQKILDVANDPANYVGKDRWVNDWYAKISENGTQTWVRA